MSPSPEHRAWHNVVKQCLPWLAGLVIAYGGVKDADNQRQAMQVLTLDAVKEKVSEIGVAWNNAADFLEEQQRTIALQEVTIQEINRTIEAWIANWTLVWEKMQKLRSAKRERDVLAWTQEQVASGAENWQLTFLKWSSLYEELHFREILGVRFDDDHRVSWQEAADFYIATRHALANLPENEREWTEERQLFWEKEIKMTMLKRGMIAKQNSLNYPIKFVSLDDYVSYFYIYGGTDCKINHTIYLNDRLLSDAFPKERWIPILGYMGHELVHGFLRVSDCYLPAEVKEHAGMFNDGRETTAQFLSADVFAVLFLDEGNSEALYPFLYLYNDIAFQTFLRESLLEEKSEEALELIHQHGTRREYGLARYFFWRASLDPFFTDAQIKSGAKYGTDVLWTLVEAAFDPEEMTPSDYMLHFDSRKKVLMAHAYSAHDTLEVLQRLDYFLYSDRSSRIASSFP